MSRLAIPSGIPIARAGRFDRRPKPAQTFIGVVSSNPSVANTKSGYAEIVASTAERYDGLLAVIGCGGSNETLTDIAIGAAGAEVIIAADLIVTASGGDSTNTGTYFIPGPIPSGSRIACANQATTTSGDNATVSLYGLVRGALELLNARSLVSYGANAADSGGLSLDPGGSANTYPASFTELTSATAKDIVGLQVGLGNRANGVRTTCTWKIQIATGAASSEVVVVDSLYAQCQTNGDLVSPMTIGPIPVSIPAGVRLSARCQCSITDATDRLLDIVVYALCSQ